MLRTAVALMLLATAAVSVADNPETMGERSQSRAREVLDRAVAANGGAEALRAVDVVRLKLSGKTYPRLQMTTPAPPFEGGSFAETLLVDLENNRLRLEQEFDGFGFDGNNTVAIVDGAGNAYDNRARTITPIPRRPGDAAAVHPVSPAPAQPAAAAGAEQRQFAALPRRRPVRGPSPGSRDIRDAGHAAGCACTSMPQPGWSRSTS